MIARNRGFCWRVARNQAPSRAATSKSPQLERTRRGVVQDGEFPKELPGKQFRKYLIRTAPSAGDEGLTSDNEIDLVTGLTFVEDVLVGLEMLYRVAPSDAEIS